MFPRILVRWSARKPAWRLGFSAFSWEHFRKSLLAEKCSHNVPTDFAGPAYRRKNAAHTYLWTAFLLLRIFCAENRWNHWLFAITETGSSTDIQTFLLVEVTLQQALESLAVAGLVLILLIAMLKSRNIFFQKVQFPMDFPWEIVFFEMLRFQGKLLPLSFPSFEDYTTLTGSNQ